MLHPWPRRTVVIHCRRVQVAMIPTGSAGTFSSGFIPPAEPYSVKEWEARHCMHCAHLCACNLRSLAVGEMQSGYFQFPIRFLCQVCFPLYDQSQAAITYLPQG